MATKNIEKLKHHEQEELCRTRPAYRQGRKLTAVKVYTINDESSHLIISGVPKLQLTNDVKRILTPYGSIKKIEPIPGYPTEDFTEAFHVRYERIQSARIAKRFVDEKNFYGGILHVCYAPELESVAETRQKLAQRRRDVSVRIKRHKEDPTNLDTDKFEPREQFHRRKKYPTLPLTEQRLAEQYPNESLNTIFNGIPRDIDPRETTEPSLPNDPCELAETSSASISKIPKAPYDDTDALGRSVVGKIDKKRKNYRGRPTNEGVKVRIVRPKIIDTKKLVGFNGIEKNVFPVVKKIQSGITIKVLTKSEDCKKRIVLKNPSNSILVQPSILRESIRTVKTNIREAMKKI